MSFLHESVEPKIAPSVLSEVANLTLAYSIAGVFLLKNRNVELDLNHVKQLIRQYFGKAKYTVSFASQESASTTFDQIMLSTPVSPDATRYVMSHMVNALTDSAVFLIENVITFVNSNEAFHSVVAQVTNNGLTNQILIDIDNVSTELPRTTTVLIDNEQVNLFKNFTAVYGFNSGIGNIGQRELNTDYGYSVHRNYIQKAFGIDIGSDSAVYCAAANNNNNPTVESIESATRTLYQEACRKINQALDGAYNPLDDFHQKIAVNMVRCCYGVNCEGDETCLIIQPDQFGHRSFDVPSTVEKIRGSGMRAQCPDNINPSIRIVDNNKNELFQLRFKKEQYKPNITGHRYKLYFSPKKVENLL